MKEDMTFNAAYERHVAPLRERASAMRGQAELSFTFGENELVFFEGIPHWMPKA